MNPAAPTPRSFDKANLTKRLLTAGVFALFFFTLLALGEHPAAKIFWLCFCALVSALGVHEMCLMARKSGARPSTLAGTLTAFGFLMHFYWMGGGALRADDRLPLWVVLAGGAITIHFGMLLFSKDRLEQALTSQAVTWLAALYMGLGAGCMVKLFMYNETTLSNTGARLLLALFLIVWLGDSMAYFIGSAFGKHKLAPKVSPKKSWEGALGNFLGNLVGAFIIKCWVCTQWSVVDMVLIGLLLGLVGQLGDLVESTWKRGVGMKDSNVGIAIPGHGGILDRVDSLMFAAPALYAYVHFVHGLS